MKDEELMRLATALPEGVHWGDPLTFDIALAIVERMSPQPTDAQAIPPREYPGDETAARLAGISPRLCSCVARGSDDPHKAGCPFWQDIERARQAWIDANVVAWSCAREAKGSRRCEKWCLNPSQCTAAFSDRRSTAQQAQPADAQADMVLVPREPTPAMVAAIDSVMWPGASEKAYRAMIAAAKGQK